MWEQSSIFGVRRGADDKSTSLARASGRIRGVDSDNGRQVKVSRARDVASSIHAYRLEGLACESCYCGGTKGRRAIESGLRCAKLALPNAGRTSLALCPAIILERESSRLGPGIVLPASPVLRPASGERPED